MRTDPPSDVKQETLRTFCQRRGDDKELRRQYGVDFERIKAVADRDRLMPKPSAPSIGDFKCR